MLPVYEMKISDNLEDKYEVFEVAGVDKPAIEETFLAFSEHESPMKFAQINDGERIAIGAAMIPNMLIYRQVDGKEFNVFFSKETIAQIALKFFAKDYQKNFNLMHDPNQQKDGVIFFQSFIKDSSKGIVGMNDNNPDGTWYLGAKILNDEVWKKIKAGEIKGWSVEGYFKLQNTEPTAEQVLSELKNILNIN